MRLDQHGLEILPRTECVQLLKTVPVGRVVTTMDDLPLALPVNFVVHGDNVVFRSAPGSKLYGAVRGRRVAFQADSYDSAGRSGWSVLIVGEARQITEEPELERVRDLPLHPWAPGPFPHYICVPMTRLSGRRISPHALDDGVE